MSTTFWRHRYFSCCIKSCHKKSRQEDNIFVILFFSLLGIFFWWQNLTACHIFALWKERNTWYTPFLRSPVYYFHCANFEMQVRKFAKKSNYKLLVMPQTKARFKLNESFHCLTLMLFPWLYFFFNSRKSLASLFCFFVVSFVTHEKGKNFYIARSNDSKQSELVNADAEGCLVMEDIKWRAFRKKSWKSKLQIIGILNHDILFKPNQFFFFLLGFTKETCTLFNQGNLES